MSTNTTTKVITGVVRLSYANVWEPTSINGGASKFGGKIPNKAALKLPLRDGDTEREDEAYKGAYFVNANSTTAPQIVDRSVQPILDRTEVYSGCAVTSSRLDSKALKIVTAFTKQTITKRFFI